MKAPFPYFGGKARVAPDVWARFGRVRNYVEPFAGSLAVLLANPWSALPVETANDADGWLTNFWRAARAAPEEVARWADYPVSELDLHARGDWLFYGDGSDAFVERMRADPDYYDAKRAGCWVWGLCAWIGEGWGRRESALGINRKLPHLGDAGRGEYILSVMEGLAERLRDVRICCGDWTRVLGPSVTTTHGLTGVFLDPPYADAEHGIVYAGGMGVWDEVCAWAAQAGDDPLLRVAVCGYDGTWTPPRGWTACRWKANGGMGNQGQARGRINKGRETIWFSPHCLQHGLALEEVA